MPNLVVIAIKRLLNGILSLCGLIRRFLTFRWLRRPQRIGELPTVMANRQNNMEEYLPSAGQQYSSSDSIGDSSWSNWSNEASANAGVSEQIEEYRRRRQEEQLAFRAAKMKRGHTHGGGRTTPSNLVAETEKSAEPDLFAELQPKMKAPKKIVLRNKNGAQVRENLFEVRDDEDIPFPGQTATEFGELQERMNDEEDLASERKRTTSWLDAEDNVDIGQLDAIEREQKKKEREERNQQRQAEHAQQLEEKRRQQQRQGPARPAEYRIQF